MRIELRVLFLASLTGVILHSFSSVAEDKKSTKKEVAGAATANTSDATSSSASADSSSEPASEEANAPAEATTDGTGASPCTLVSCSGHGACVLREGQPMCACDPGYAPDSKTGLSCIALAPQQPVVAVPVVTGPSPEQAKEAEEMNAAVESVAPVLSPRQARTYYYRYKSLYRNNAFSGTFQDYLIRRYTSKRNAGIAFTIVGACLISASVSFGVVSSNIFYSDEELGAAFAVLSVISGASGLTFLSIGIANTAVGGSKVRRLKKLQSSSVSTSAMGGLHIYPFLTRTGRGTGDATAYGLGASLRF